VANVGPVRSARALYARFRHLIHEGARFGVVGLAGLAVTDGGANLLRYQAGMGRLSSVAIATVAAIAITFVPSRYWTFRHRERSGVGRETAVFFAVNGIGVAIYEACVGLTYPLHLDSEFSYNIALNGGIALGTLFRYWSYKKWVWPAGTVTSAGESALLAPAHRRPVRALGQVRVTRPLYGRFWLLVYELARFGMVGAFAFLVAGAGTTLLHFQAGVGALTSNVIATVVATVVSYAGNRNWTFRHRQRTSVGREGIVFFALNATGLAIQLACLGLATYVLSLDGKLSYSIALVIGIGLGTLFRYWSYRKWVWRAQPPAPPATAQPRETVLC
jgi:putative flippase GtrA